MFTQRVATKLRRWELHKKKGGGGEMEMALTEKEGEETVQAVSVELVGTVVGFCQRLSHTSVNLKEQENFLPSYNQGSTITCMERWANVRICMYVCTCVCSCGKSTSKNVIYSRPNYTGNEHKN